ncbi:hypothetical protein SAMN02983003_0992 [Devosia enhydra]|uniref:Uncharacterized protein n=1 Tax=Devosia enhydra TaxID=665118 RepID=A0A1K2HUR8_9HYPH|nr:hypothetical protein [Devosia enhydra]SFZ82292.1 hypothetical protein SAMN02983003_0992 [Devosia enhydra]
MTDVTALPASATPAPEHEEAGKAQRPSPRQLWGKFVRWPRLPVISFSLTIAAAGIGLLAGVLPAQVERLTPQIDTAVVLLFVPLCILVLAILAEAVRLSPRGPVRIRDDRPMRTLTGWSPPRA